MTRTSVLLQVAARPLYPIIVGASIWLLLRGHNQPGGGFIGALVAVTATVLWCVAFGREASLRRLPFRSATTLAVVGAIVSAVSGLVALALGKPYMTHPWWTIPGIELKVSTVMAFDLGVYLCVWGALAGYVTTMLDLEPRGDEPEVDREAPR